MKKIISYSFLLLSLAFLAGCKKNNYPGGTISPIISVFDVKELYKGNDVILTRDNMFGSNQIAAMVISDHSGGNLPAGLLVVQESRRLAQLRGISISIGADASKYLPGDSVVINVENGVLKRVDGVLQITGVPASAVTRISSGNQIPVNRVASNAITAAPEKYENTLVVIVKAGFNPLPVAGDILSGDKVVNDGFADLPLHTEATALFAKTPAPFLANFYGIVFSKVAADKQLVPQLRMRTIDDLAVLSSTINVTPIIITGFISDVIGGDGNYEYVQLMATRNLDFAVTPYSLVFTNNANASIPTGYPASGWATGTQRTYKLNITSGTAAKGTLFYVGGTNKLINGVSSTSISAANWVKNYDYVAKDGEGFGTKTGGLLANSGNASGIAVFTGTNVTVTSQPIDVMFVSNGGSLYIATPSQQGYRITNTDWYDVVNPITLQDQPFFRSGTNTLNMVYTTADLGYFYKLGGEYNVTLGRWMKARSQTNVLLSKSSTLAEIEGDGLTKLLQ